VIGSGKCLFQGESQMKKRYQIDKQRAVQKFRQLANQADQSIQLGFRSKKSWTGSSAG
jgi:hypothetical protein